MQEHPVDVKGGSPNPVVLAILLAVLMGVIELPFAAFMADDFIQLGILEHVSPCTWIGPTNLYTISDGDPVHVGIMKNAGAFPWFFGREFKMAFFRPLSSALLALDHVFFGLNPVGYRIHGILWFLLLVLGFGSLLRSILPESLTRLALIVFTISGIHGILCWTATRHIVIAAAVCMLGVSCHVRWRAGGWRPGRFLSIACFALSLTASEAAIGMVIYLLAYEAFGAPGRRKECLKACLPITVVISLYLVLYALFKFGASGGSGYINPLQEPLTFLIQLPVRLVVLMGAMLAGGNADLWVLRPHLRPVMFGAGMFFVAVFAMLLRAVWARISTEERQAARWLTAGSLASAIPFTGTPIGSRCLVVPFIGGSVVIALVLHYWWKERRRTHGWKYRLIGATCAFLAFIHLVMAPVGRLASPYLLRLMMFENLRTSMKDAELDQDCIDVQTVILLTAPDIAVGFHSYFYRMLYRMPMPAAWRVLSWGPYTHRFHRVSTDTLDMELVDGEIQAPFFKSGDVVDLEGMRATVLGANGDGPTRIRFQFNRPLDDPSLYFMAWKDGRLLHIQPPQLGQSLQLP